MGWIVDSDGKLKSDDDTIKEYADDTAIDADKKNDFNDIDFILDGVMLDQEIEILADEEWNEEWDFDIDDFIDFFNEG